MAKSERANGGLVESDYPALQRLQEWPGLRELDELLRQLRQAPNFFTTVPRTLRAEGVHTDMLAWLLNPTGWHGLREVFVLAFIREVLSGCGIERSGPIVVRNVQREVSTGKGPIDILLRAAHDGKPLMIGIENKIDAAESEAQLHRYGEGLRASYPDVELFLVLLAPEERQVGQAPSCPHTPMAYSKIVSVLEQALLDSPPEGTGPLNTAGRVLADHYLAALRNHIMPESHPKIEALCRELYDQHRQAWRAIRKRLPSERDDIHEHLGSALCAQLAQEHGGDWKHVVRPDAYVRVFRAEWCSLGSKAASAIVGVQEAEQDRTYASLHFRVVADPPDADADPGFGYSVRIKAPSPSGSAAAAAVAKAVSAVKGVATPTTQYTFGIRSAARRPGIGEDGAVPDEVVAWFARYMKPYILAIDGALKRRSARARS